MAQNKDTRILAFPYLGSETKDVVYSFEKAKNLHFRVQNPGFFFINDELDVFATFPSSSVILPDKFTFRQFIGNLERKYGPAHVYAATDAWAKGVESGKFDIRELGSTSFRCFVHILDGMLSFEGEHQMVCMQYFFDHISEKTMDDLHAIASEERVFRGYSEDVPSIFMAFVHAIRPSLQGEIFKMNRFDLILEYVFGDASEQLVEDLEIMFSKKQTQESFSDLSKDVLDCAKCLKKE
jgi:hypothetical protein